MLCSFLAVHALYALTAAICAMRSLRSRRTVVTVRGTRAFGLLASFTRTRAPTSLL